jgi:anti-sigma B factor antagonist
MTFKVLKNAEDIYIVEPEGRLDLLSSTKLKETVMKLLELKIESIIINLEKVTFINSTGIGALINISSTLRKLNLKFAIASLSAPVKQTMELLNLSGYFPIAADLRNALDLVQSKN